MGDVYIPSLKDLLWHKMRSDLARFIPDIKLTQLLMCPACCRFLHYKDFSVEHIIPKQALKDDPEFVKGSLTVNERSKNILLCNKTLKVNGVKVHGLGCNSWKGKYYDRYAREMLNGSAYSSEEKLYGQHTTAISAIGYLALVQNFGYQSALLPSGLLMRKQFFSPNGFVEEMPLKCQILLMSDIMPPSEDNIDIWSDPFHFTIDRGYCLFSVRGMCTYLPLSRDPSKTLAFSLPFIPRRYSFKPNFYTVFD